MTRLLGVVERVASGAAFSLGPELEAFESEYAAFCGTAEAVGVASGTDALLLTLRALGVGPGDEVIVPANSFIASAEAVSLAGAAPRFADVEPEHGLLTAETVEVALGARTRAVIAVHLHGRTVELGPIAAVVRDRGVALIEDACQAHGAWLNGERVGAIGDAGCFSFYPSKNLGAWGDGGAVVSDDGRLAARLRRLRNHGSDGEAIHAEVGTTARLDALQAAILRAKLPLLDGFNQGRRQVAAELSTALARSGLGLPEPPPDGHDHVFHHYVVRTSTRDGLRAHLADRGIASAVHYPVPLHLTGAYRQPAGPAPSLPAAEARAREICSLPISPTLRPDEIDRIAAAVDEFARRPGG